MAFTANEQFDSADQGSFPGVAPETVAPREVGAIGAAPLLKVLTPMHRSTVDGKWYPWSHTAGAGGANVIAGFLYPDKCQTDASHSVLAVMLLEGKVDYNGILAAIPTGEVEADLKADLKLIAVRNAGLYVTNLAGVA